MDRGTFVGWIAGGSLPCFSLRKGNSQPRSGRIGDLDVEATP